MKPVYLEFCGINSFSEKAEIDFRALLRGGVFGIFGDTGSGKSTILDSIHFALYGEIDRAPKAFNDCINYHSEQAYVQFEFELATDGVRKTYRVRRERKRKSGSTKAWLYEKTDAGEWLALAEGTRDVDERVERIVGLSFADFKTCIALPQGDFAALVKSTPSERVKLVARLFDLEKYGERLSHAVNDKYYRAEEEVRLVKAKMGENEGGGEELIEELRKKLDFDKAALTETKESLTKAEEAYLKEVALQKEKRAFDALCAKLERLTAGLAEAEETRRSLEMLPRALAVAEKSRSLGKTRNEKLAAESAATKAKADRTLALEKLTAAKTALADGKFEERIVEASVDLQKVRDAEKDFEAERKAKNELDACIVSYNELRKNTLEEDFAGKRAGLEEQIAALGEDDSLLSYLKHNYKDVLLGDTYGEIRGDLRVIGEKYPQTREDIEALVIKYTPKANADREFDIAAVNLAFKELERKRKALKAELETLEKRQRAYEEIEGKKKLLVEQGKILRKNYELAAEKTAAVKELGTEKTLSDRLEALKKQQLAAQSAIDAAQEKANGFFAEAQKQEGVFALCEKQEKELESALARALTENGFCDETEAFALIERLGDGEKAKRENKDFFDEYGSCKKQLEQTDKSRFDGYDEGAVARTEEARRAAREAQEALLQEIGSGENKLKHLLGLREKYRELEKELAEKEKRKDLCDELRSLLKSNRFLEFIASEYLQEICVSASKTLLSLTGGRYFLQYDKDFKVGDNFDGGNLRAVKTLSGGETFLVSLSLALSLSAAICLKSLRPIEFFFLDEGFGTLDEKLVETVMDVLGKLSKSFAVGLISHVEELKHRIDNKILVTGANDKHGSCVRVECF
ncbi:MAG: SMC family ATPase [Clostridia bacterium]|nr:SMC family ATPase [Clostridia bacterium]